MRIASKLLFFAALASFPLVLWAQSARALVNYQGVLRSAAGAPLTGSYDMDFSFFDAATDGNQLLIDSHRL